MQIAGGELPLGWTAAARVVVSDADANQARQFAEAFDRQTARESPDAAMDQPALDQWTDWPLCPKCGARRSARCSVCGTSGTDFALADVQNSTRGDEVLLKCESCDDLFVPDWYRLCPQCGYDFGKGIEVGESAPPMLEVNFAMLSIVAGLLVGGGALMAYWYW